MKSRAWNANGWTPRPAKQIEDYTPKPRAPALRRHDGKARMVVPVPKSEPVRDQNYLRWVASLPCIACSIEGRSQAAHGPSLGRGIKACDTTAVPLCADSPGVVGCHSLVDRYEAFGRAERVRKMAEWAEQIRALWAQRGEQ